MFIIFDDFSKRESREMYSDNIIAGGKERLSHEVPGATIP